jgi:hypothetical protein
VGVKFNLHDEARGVSFLRHRQAARLKFTDAQFHSNPFPFL